MSENNKLLYYFNPGHEGAILNGSSYYMSPANVVKMQQDLELLPIWYANKASSVLITQKPNNDFLNNVYYRFQNLSSFVTKAEFDTQSAYEVHLWGMSPQAIHFFEELRNETFSKLTIPLWNEKIKELSSRKFAQACLSALTKDIQEISKDIVPEFHFSLDTIREKVESSSFQLLAKAPYSSSGRGLLWLPVGKLTRTEEQILHGILKKQTSVSIEKCLNKKIDFAMEFMADESSVEFAGYSLFETNSKGSYTGNTLMSQNNIEIQINQLIDSELIEKVKSWLKAYILQNISPFYQGCIGIDMMIYEDNSTFKLQPCVEINLRDNMGLVALRISQNYLGEDIRGKFCIDFCPQENELLNQHRQMQVNYPTLFDNNDKLISGYISLCPINIDTKYRAYILLD